MITSILVLIPTSTSGKPCIAGTYISVDFVLEQLALGYTIEKLLDAYPQLTREQIVAVLDFARESIRNEYSEGVMESPKLWSK